MKVLGSPQCGQVQDQIGNEGSNQAYYVQYQIVEHVFVIVKCLKVKQTQKFSSITQELQGKIYSIYYITYYYNCTSVCFL